ncbi:1166_t:CDS:2, partial [Racocetra fulgida]
KKSIDWSGVTKGLRFVKYAVCGKKCLQQNFCLSYATPNGTGFK